MHEDLLRCILECGKNDLCLLDDIGYDVEEIVEYMLETGQRPTLNRILDEVFRRGVQQLADVLDEKLGNATKQLIAGRWTKKTAELVGALSGLRPWDDVGWYCNCQRRLLRHQVHAHRHPPG